MIKFSVMLMLIFGCSLIDEPIYSIDSKIEPYYLMFLEEGKKRGLDYSGRDIFMYFGNIDVMGKSVWRMDGVVEIIINDSEWNKERTINSISRQLKEMTIMHELGHALLGRTHTENKMSVMSTGNTEKYANYEKYRKEMLDELFVK